MTITLYHYTNIDGYTGITRSGKLIPSYRYKTLDASYGDGHYFTDRPPSTYDEELFELWGQELPDRVRAYVAFEIDKSLVEWCRDNVYRLPLGTVLEHSLNISTTYTDPARTKIMIRFVDHGQRNNKRKPNNSGDIFAGIAITVGIVGLIALLFGRKK